jgi:Family of unknown function (DUF6090)
MIKFFRHIRKDLMENNKTGRYLKYAIGEIVLVMIGILLALQVSNWNQERKDRISERKLLDNIHRDFTKNKVSFDSMKVINHKSLAALDSMIALFPLHKDSLKITKFYQYLSQIEEITYNAYSSTVESVINSNSLQLIRNERLQEYLVSWKDVLLDFQEEETAYFRMMNDLYWPYMLEVFDYTGNNRAMGLATLSTIKYQNMVINRRAYLRGIVKAIKEEPIENHIDEIIRLTGPNP